MMRNSAMVPKPCVHVPSTSPFFVSGTFDLFLMDRMGVQPIFSFQVALTIDTMLNFDGDFDGQGDVTCKQTLNQCYVFRGTVIWVLSWYFISELPSIMAHRCACIAEEEHYPVKARRNGWTWPPNPLQFIAWFFTFYFFLFHNLVVASSFVDDWQPLLYIVSF